MQIPVEDRVAEDAPVGALLTRIEELQVPCPWGELTDTEKPPHKGRFPNIPVGLVLGCGQYHGDTSYRFSARTRSFSQLVLSDISNPLLMPRDNYVQLDLTNPETIHLNGYRVHAIFSSAVFTYDSLGVRFANEEQEHACSSALNNLLWPGGIYINLDGLFKVGRFERVLEEQQGFRQVYELPEAVMLQKPF